MGILDRFSYPDLTAIPRNWNMTTMDSARIEERNDKLRLAVESHSASSTSTPPQLLMPVGPSHETSGVVEQTYVTALAHQSTEPTIGPPPKKKR